MIVIKIPFFLDDGSGEIKDHLIDELDYVLLPEEAWELLVKWYGLMEGQQVIARKVVEYGMFVKHCKVGICLFITFNVPCWTFIPCFLHWVNFYKLFILKI